MNPEMLGSPVRKPSDELIAALHDAPRPEHPYIARAAARCMTGGSSHSGEARQSDMKPCADIRANYIKQLEQQIAQVQQQLALARAAQSQSSDSADADEQDYWHETDSGLRQ